MIYPIKSNNYEISKSEFKSNVQKLNPKKVKYFEYIDKPMLDEVVKEIKRTSNYKDFHLIVLEV